MGEKMILFKNNNAAVAAADGYNICSVEIFLPRHRIQYNTYLMICVKYYIPEFPPHHYTPYWVLSLGISQEI